MTTLPISVNAYYLSCCLTVSTFIVIITSLFPEQFIFWISSWSVSVCFSLSKHRSSYFLFIHAKDQRAMAKLRKILLCYFHSFLGLGRVQRFICVILDYMQQLASYCFASSALLLCQGHLKIHNSSSVKFKYLFTKSVFNIFQQKIGSGIKRSQQELSNKPIKSGFKK